MDFLLTGFTHDKDSRIFAFESIGTDRIWTKCTVRADLSVARKYGIALQELPLLCRGLLDRRDLGADNVMLTLGEDEIRTLAEDRAAARAALPKRKPPVKPAGEPTDSPWRGQQSATQFGRG